MTSDEARNLWEKAIHRRKELAGIEASAKVDADSVLAGAIRRLRDAGDPATLIEKLAKGEADVMASTKSYLDAANHTKAVDAYLEWIAATVVDLRHNQRQEANITR
jgi:hypothetical protein